MGELARIRSARDLRVSRGHLAAALVATFLVGVTAFALGASLGGDPPAPAARGFTAEVPGDDLLELLARIDASSLPGGGAETLTYQDDLRGPAGTETAAPVQPAAPATEVVQIEAGPARVPVVADPAPAGAFTVWITESADPEVVRSMRARLRDDGQPAWVAATLVDGEPRYTVAIGGYATEEEAVSAGSAAHEVTGLPVVVRELDQGVIGAPVSD